MSFPATSPSAPSSAPARPYRLYVLLSVLCCVIAAACGSDSSDSADATGTSQSSAESATSTAAGDTSASSADPGAGDDEDEATTFHRIVSISPTATEMLFAIGAGDQVIAVDSLSTFPAEAPVTDLAAYEPSLEAIAAYDPDLVVLSFDPDNGGFSAALEQVGISTVLQAPAASLDDVYDQIAELGILTGRIDEAAALNAQIRADIEAAVADAGDAQGVRIYHEIDDTFYSSSSHSFVGEIYQLFGVTNIADEADVDGSGYPQLSAEYIIDADPQIIVFSDGIGYDASAIAARPGWNVISAVADDRIIGVNADVASRWGPRVVEFIEILSDALAGVPAS